MVGGVVVGRPRLLWGLRCGDWGVGGGASLAGVGDHCALQCVVGGGGCCVVLEAEDGSGVVGQHAALLPGPAAAVGHFVLLQHPQHLLHQHHPLVQVQQRLRCHD